MSKNPKSWHRADRRAREKRYHPPGTPPGTLQRGTEAAVPAPRCLLTEFGDEGLRQREIGMEALDQIRIPEHGVLWLEVAGLPSEAQLYSLGQTFRLHQLALEDVVNQGQRPKLDDYDDALFVVLSRPLWRDGEVRLQQVNLFFGRNFVVSIAPAGGDPFAPVHRHLKERPKRFVDGGADYLLYALMDVVVDEGFPVLDALGEDIEQTELELLNHPDPGTLAHVHSLKRDLVLLRRQLWPTREAMNQLLRSENPLLQASLAPYLKDVYDHSIYLIDLIESYRDMTASMVDVYLSSVSYRLNDIMRVLTIIATIFIPLTFITGVYGMNFAVNEHSPWAMPELHWYYGYPLVWLVMILVPVGMLVYFKRKRWL